MEILRLYFVSFLICSIVGVACRGDETTSRIAVEAMLRTEKWYSGLKSYDLEVETRKYHERDELGKAITEASLSKEIFSAEKIILTSVDSSGSWILDLGNSGSSDVIKTVFRIGSATEGKAWTKGFSPGWLSCKGLACIQAARQTKHSSKPMVFAMPVPEEYGLLQMKEIANRFLKHPELLSSETTKIDLMGAKKSVEKIRMLMKSPDPKTGSSDAFGIEMCISDEEKDDGMVVSMSWYELKDKDGEFKSDDDTRFLERSVVTKWDAVELEGKSCPVPKECLQTFYEVVNGKKKATIKQTTNWKFLKHGDSVSVPTEEQLIGQGDELEKRVNKLMRR